MGSSWGPEGAARPGSSWGPERRGRRMGAGSRVRDPRKTPGSGRRLSPRSANFWLEDGTLSLTVRAAPHLCYFTAPQPPHDT
eukprot:7389850-Prymnesium_polylepis.2